MHVLAQEDILLFSAEPLRLGLFSEDHRLMLSISLLMRIIRDQPPVSYFDCGNP